MHPELSIKTIKNKKMKKNVIVLTAILSISAAFVSCSSTDVYEEGAAEKAKVMTVETQYKENFVKHFGEVSSDQSWDFSKSNIQMVEESANARQTRALLNVTSFEAPIWKRPSLFDSNNQPDYYAHVYTDFEAVKQCAEDPTIRPIEWPYEYAEIKLHPFYGYGKKDVNSFRFGLTYKSYEFSSILGTTTLYNNDGFYEFQIGQGWSKIYNYNPLETFVNMYSYRYINTTNMRGVDGFGWWTASGIFDNKSKLNYCKIYTVNKHTYVGIDCDGDGNFSDVICWVEDMSPAKRYMVEDLGSTSDFDFNDIVFDVVRKDGTNNEYECLVRAMGGTLNFTIKVGESVWSKSPTYDSKQIINTKEGDYDLDRVYARFDVNGWVPENNDVTVTVEGKEGVFVLPFPKDGEIPYMVATSIGKEWSKETVDVTTIGWFGSVQNDVVKTPVSE